MIQIKLASFGYDKRLVLKDINVTIADRELITVIGPNGGGKTTFIKLLAGLLSPLSGSVEWEGSQDRSKRHAIGYVPQITHFDKDFPISVQDVVLGGLISELPWHGRFSRAQKRQAGEILSQLKLAQLANTPFGDLSGGQAQRVLIARALVAKPQLLLLDEPTANVDKDAKELIYSVLRDLKGKMTIVVVTHETPGLIPLSDRVFCIQTELVEMMKQAVCNHFTFGVYHETRS